MKLVIVESPTKTHTLKRYLGDEYEVLASKGHIRDLAIRGHNGYGVDVANNFNATYEVKEDSKKIVNELKKVAKKSDEVILATDPDREGEAIAWHLAKVLDLDINTTKRLEFHEITRDSITQAIQEPRTIDLNLVLSQETRRIIDRIIGFDLSKITQKYIKSKSAGRVQSVTLSLICKHELEIQNFVPQKYYSISVTLDNLKYSVSIDEYNGKKIDKITDESLAKEIFNDIGNSLVVKNIEIKERSVKSKEPFTTSTLQQEAFNRFGFSTKETSLIAQKLYEGVNTPDGLVGLITYMRTDSTKLSTSYINRAKNYINEFYGEKYFSGEKSVKHVQNAQEAHEAIRPTSNHRTPDSLKEYLSKKEYQLYKLIYSRAQASLMSDMILQSQVITLSSNKTTFKLEGSLVLFDGYSKVYEEKREKPNLSKIKLGDEFKVLDKKLEEDFTKAPPRYSEAKVVKLMEEEGIGRPSTYSATIQILLQRDYVTSKKGILQPTEQGMLTAEFLEKNFSDFVNASYTAKMEKDLDNIEAGSSSRINILSGFYKEFENEISNFKNSPKFLPDKKEPEKTGEKCPLCGGDLVKRKSKYGEFVGCINYPTCRYIKPTEKVKKEVEFVGRKCPQCGGELVYREGKKGKFIACNNFPKCRYIEALKEDNEKTN